MFIVLLHFYPKTKRKELDVTEKKTDSLYSYNFQTMKFKVHVKRRGSLLVLS